MGMATTATRAEVETLMDAIRKLEPMLRQVVQGDAAPATPGRYTAAEVDTQITAVSNAINAVNI